MTAVWWMLLIISLLAYVSLAALVLPRVFLRSGYNIASTYDRGLKNFKEKNGRTIVYEPKPEYRSYISQYILSQRNAKKVLLCKLKDNISYLDYDIVLFDGNDKVFKVINVKENIERAGYSRIVQLPAETAYVTLIVNSTDNNTVKVEAKAFNRRTASFALSMAALAVLEVFFVKLCFAGIFADVFGSEFLSSAVNVATTSAIALVAAAANVIAVWLYFRRKAKTRGQ